MHSLVLKLAELEGLEPMDMLERGLFDGTCPAICTRPGCEYTANYEPDQDAGWCEECGANTVKSALILAGVA